MTPSWLQTLHRLLPAESGGHTYRAIALGRELPYPRNIKFLVFADDDAEPSWILRCHREASIAVREELVLREMQSRGYHVQPELVGCGSCEDMHAQLIRFCKGRHGSLDVWRSPGALRMLSSELAHVQVELASWAQSMFDARPLQTAHVLDAMNRVGGPTANETHLDRTLEQARECLARSKAPSLPQHGDCCTANMLWDGVEIRVLDWEHFGFAFEPFTDIWMFALSLCEDSGDLDAASLFRTGPNAAAAESAVRCYASGVGLAAESGRVVFPLAVARLVQLNAALGRTAVARRMCRILNAYLADASTFMSGLN